MIRVKKFDDRIIEELYNFNTVEKQRFSKIIENLYHNKYIRLNWAEMKAKTIRETFVARIKGDNTFLLHLKFHLKKRKQQSLSHE